MKKIILNSVCFFFFLALNGQIKEKKELENEKLNEIEVKGKIKKRASLKYSKVTKLKSHVYAFGSEIIDDKIYVVGGDFSVKVNLGDKILDRTTVPAHEFNTKEFFRLLRRHRSSFDSYSDKLQVYDLNSKEWLKPKIKLGNRAYHNINSYNNELYIFGGKRLSKNKKYEYLNEKIEVLNLNSLKVVTDYTNPHQAINFASTVYKNYLIVAGGSAKKNYKKPVEYSNQFHFYDFSTGLWYELPDIPIRKEGKGILVGSKFYLVGGFNGKALKSIESFDFKKGKWKKERNLPVAMSAPGLASKGKYIFIYDKDIILIYDIKKETVLKYHIKLNLNYASMHYYKDALYIIGGVEETDYSKEPLGDIYKVGLNEFNKTEFK